MAALEDMFDFTEHVKSNIRRPRGVPKVFGIKEFESYKVVDGTLFLIRYHLKEKTRFYTPLWSRAVIAPGDIVRVKKTGQEVRVNILADTDMALTSAGMFRIRNLEVSEALKVPLMEVGEIKGTVDGPN